MIGTKIKGATIMLASGKYFDLENPEFSEFGINDIAHALAHICRYTGHCREFYSVAQHSVLVSCVVPPEYSFHGLMHDAAEAFIGDVAKPLKMLLPDYKVIEERIELAVFARFGLPAKIPQCVKDADRVLLRTEQRDLMGADAHEWSFTDGVAPLQQRIEPLAPAEARRMFLDTYDALVRTQPHLCGPERFSAAGEFVESRKQSPAACRGCGEGGQMICRCGCGRNYPANEMYDLRVLKPVSRECHKRRLAMPRKPMNQRIRELPADVARTLSRWR